MKRLLISLLLCGAAVAQVAEKANEGYKTKEGRESVANNLSSAAREERQKPRELIESMNLRPGMKVADVGTGVGFMLPYLSHAVGPTGQVIGEDIAQDFIDKARVRTSTMGLKNVKFVLGSDHDPNLPGGVLDAVLVLDAYHHFDYPEAMLKGLRESLVSDGKLYIVDYYKRPNAMGAGSGDRALEHIRLDQDDVIKEVEEHGFKLVSKHDHIPASQYVAVFEKRAEP